MMTTLSRYINNTQVRPHFNLRELMCPCCGLFKMDCRVLDVLEWLRVESGRPVIVTSGYRCPTHNIAVGGAPDGDHPRATAVDVVIRGMSSGEIAEMAARCPLVKRIGTYSDKDCVHVSVVSRVAEGFPDRFHI